MMQKIVKNEKGSISLFVLLSALFFLVVVTSVGVSLKNKEASIDAQFEKTKQSYEKDVGNEEQIYEERVDEKLLDRTGIKVGDYIKYVPIIKSAYSEHLTSDYTGYTSNQTLDQQYKTWRVLNKKDDGNLEIMPAFDKADLSSENSDFTTLYFRDAKGYNNAVYILDEICEYLYTDEEKGIIARSIDYDDIITCLKEGENDTEGLKKIAKYQSDAISNLTIDSNCSVAKDLEKNTVTYKNVRSNYPEIYENQEGAGIDIYSNNNGTITYNPPILQKGQSGVIGENDKYYTNLSTTIGSKNALNNLTAKYTYYYGTINKSEFKDYVDNKSDMHNVIFGTETNYWLASRCVYCNSRNACFLVRGINFSDIGTSDLDSCFLYVSAGLSNSANYHVCPIVSIPANVKIKVNTDGSEYHQSHPHEIID